LYLNGIVGVVNKDDVAGIFSRFGREASGGDNIISMVHALRPRTFRSVVMQKGHNADRARGDDTVARRLPGRLFPDEDSLHKAVVEQLRAAIAAHTLPDFEGELPESDDSANGAIPIPDVKVVLQLRTWQAIGFYVNELFTGCV
jgi:hypothetical protein